MKTFRLEFGILEFNSIGSKEIKMNEILDTAEQTFNACLLLIPKRLLKTWQSIEFEFNNQTILVCKHWLIETNFDFENSHQITN